MNDDFDRAKVGYDRMDAHDKEVWNAAIEAAAMIADDADEYAATEIRKLKK